MESHTKYPWFIVDIVLYLGLNALVWWWAGDQRRDELFNLFSPLRLVVLGLATYRLAQVISNETITEPLRAPFVRPVEQAGKEVERPRKRGYRGALGSLIYCPSCTGAWAAAVFVHGMLFVPQLTYFAAIILSLSAAERIVTGVLDKLKRQ